MEIINSHPVFAGRFRGFSGVEGTLTARRGDIER